MEVLEKVNRYNKEFIERMSIYELGHAGTYC